MLNGNEEENEKLAQRELMKSTCLQLIDINNIRKITKIELKLNTSKANIIGIGG